MCVMLATSPSLAGMLTKPCLSSNRIFSLDTSGQCFFHPTMVHCLFFFFVYIVSLYQIAGSKRARNLVYTPCLDFGGNSFCQNRSKNPRKPIRSHFHSNKIFKRLRRDCTCERSSKPKFRIIEVLMLI